MDLSFLQDQVNLLTSEQEDMDSFIVPSNYAEIEMLLTKPSVKEMLALKKYNSKGHSDFREFCTYQLKSDCQRVNGNSCQKLHFNYAITPITDLSLGDCSYLNSCYRTQTTCRFAHYDLEDPTGSTDAIMKKQKDNNCFVDSYLSALPAQWLNCDIRSLDFGVLGGNFDVILCDCPWSIHQSLPYGTLSDQEIKNIPFATLQTEGFLFLWVTGRATDVGREILKLNGYHRLEDIVWVKTNHIQKLIRTGRTGHHLNHSVEHLLVAYRGDLSKIKTWTQRGIDCDVLVSSVRELTSRKPEELYGIIERLVGPHARKIELFGRIHNLRDGWWTIGNELGSHRVFEKDVAERYSKVNPHDSISVSTLPASWWAEQMEKCQRQFGCEK